MLEFDPDRAAVPPRAAATLIVLRDGDEGLEIFCVRRHAKSAFLGGAVVFPGGKLDPADATIHRTRGLPPRALAFGAEALALAVCGCREALEEATLLPAVGADGDPPGHDHARALRLELEAGADFATILAREDLTLTTDALVPFARWVTPEAEQRRFDACFFLVALPVGQRGEPDARETTSGVWASPRRMLEHGERGDVFLAPPTIRCFELLATASTTEGALALGAVQSLEPIQPVFIPGDPPCLALPGDPAHPVAERRVAGPTRFVMEDGRFVGVDP